MSDFSIIIPAYNNLTLFSRALDSVRKQKDVSVQIIVVDDSNQNDDIEHYVCNLEDSRILYFHNRPSLGAVPNWNSGLRKASGNHVILMHHDESFLGEDHLRLLLDSFRKADIVIGNIKVSRSDGVSYSLFPTWFKRLAMRIPSILFCVNALGPCAVFAFKREALQEFDEHIHWFVDVDWYYQMLKSHTSRLVPTATVLSYHGHSGQITNTINTVEEAKKDVVAFGDKYHNNMAVRFAMWLQINVLHNEKLHRILKKLSGR